MTRDERIARIWTRVGRLLETDPLRALWWSKKMIQLDPCRGTLTPNQALADLCIWMRYRRVTFFDSRGAGGLSRPREITHPDGTKHRWANHEGPSLTEAELARWDSWGKPSSS